MEDCSYTGTMYSVSVVYYIERKSMTVSDVNNSLYCIELLHYNHLLDYDTYSHSILKSKYTIGCVSMLAAAPPIHCIPAIILAVGGHS